eukprot:Pompholyxophrys_punicea_v1_NODE_121_length_3355_cov_8.294759.p2 type:complete len:183 gc:universal NODE_121_length_3355_cov_8.294759:142-690(+)
MHQVTTLAFGERVKDLATDLNDSELLSKLAFSDLVALEATYHKECHVNLYNKHVSWLRQRNDTENFDSESKAVVFTELVNYMSETMENTNQCIFKMSDILAIYMRRLQVLGEVKQINRTRLKKKILDYFQVELQEQSDGYNTLLVQSEGMHKLLQESVFESTFEKDTVILAKAAKIIRKEKI